MAVKIRLRRMGNRNRPFYRLVVSDSRNRRDGAALEDLGWYDPLKNPAQSSMNEESILKWLERGAQVSDTARSLIKRAGILTKFQEQRKREGDRSFSPELPPVES